MAGLENPWKPIAATPEVTGKPQPVVGMIIFPGLTLLDLIGPQTVLHGPTETLLISKTKDFVISDTGLHLRPTHSFDEAPKDLDILFIPGGPGQVEIMEDPAYMDFIADRGARAKYVTSVCTGAIVLGAAGLLKGYKAATHWAAMPALPMYGAEPVYERVVIDRNRITGGGVTAGIDFGLVLLNELFDGDIAKITQLLMEYNPSPPFNAGSPEGAGEAIVERAMPMLQDVAEKTIAVTERLLRNEPRLADIAASVLAD